MFGSLSAGTSQTKPANALANLRSPPSSDPPGPLNWALPPPPGGLFGLINTPAPTTTTKRRVFISFRAEDKNKVNGLRLLNANDKFDIEFYDESVRSPYDSTDPAYIKRCIREKIRRTKVTVCMVSEWTYTSDWVDWELEEGIANRNNIFCMGFKDSPASLTLPKRIRELGIGWWLWDHEHLHRLVGQAT